jgi:hypothetical protein
LTRSRDDTCTASSSILAVRRQSRRASRTLDHGSAVKVVPSASTLTRRSGSKSPRSNAAVLFSSQFFMEHSVPRLPTAEELVDLEMWTLNNLDDEDEEHVETWLNRAHIAVFDVDPRASRDSSGKLMVAVWNRAGTSSDAFTWDDEGRLLHVRPRRDLPRTRRDISGLGRAG